MAREGIERGEATGAIVRAAAFASSEYDGHPLDGRIVQAL
jgi:hypothetical protein